MCRYEEDKFRKVDPPPKKKKSEENKAEDAGWESTAPKKKAAGKKAPLPLSFPGFSPKVSDMLAQCHEAGIVSKGELDERVMEDLKALPERGASTSWLTVLPCAVPCRMCALPAAPLVGSA